MVGAPAVAATAVFLGAIALTVVWENYRVPIVGAGAAIAVGVGLVPTGALVPQGWGAGGSVVEWNALALLTGLILFGALFGALGLTRAAALTLAFRLKGNPVRLFATLAGLAFALSMLLTSVAVILILIGVTLEICQALRIPPIPFVLGEVSAANIGGAGTLFGSPPNVILGTKFALSFPAFLTHTGPAALAALAVTVLLFVRSMRPTPGAPPPSVPRPTIELDRPHVLVAIGAFVVMIAFLVEGSSWGIPIWMVGVAGGGAAVAIAGPRFARGLVEDLDWQTLLFLALLFVLVGALLDTGAIAAFAGGLLATGVTDPIALGLVLLWALAGLSMLIDNVPLAAVAAPLVAQIGAAAQVGTTGLVYAATLGLNLGGNGTPIGSAAGIVGLAEAERRGFRVGWRRFVRQSGPIMVAALAAASVVWIFVAR